MLVTESILSQFKNGDIHEFYKEIYPSLLRFAMRFLGQELAYMGEDCVADTVFKAYQNRHSFNTPIEMKAFLYTCLHNEIVNIFKKNESQKRYISHQHLLHDDEIDSVVMQETLDKLQKAVDELPERLRQVFTFAFEDGLKRAEIAERLNVSEATVKRDKSKLVQILREKFKDDTIMRVLLIAYFNSTL